MSWMEYAVSETVHTCRPTLLPKKNPSDNNIMVIIALNSWLKYRSGPLSMLSLGVRSGLLRSLSIMYSIWVRWLQDLHMEYSAIFLPSTNTSLAWISGKWWTFQIYRCFATVSWCTWLEISHLRIISWDSHNRQLIYYETRRNYPLWRNSTTVYSVSGMICEEFS